MARHRTALAAAITLGLLAPGATSTEGETREPATTAGGAAQVVVLNTQLRGITNPEIMPTGAWGHLQIKFVPPPDDGVSPPDNGAWVPAWKGRLFNPDGHEFISGFVVELEGEAGGPPPSEGGEILVGSVVLDLFRGSSASCGIIDLESQAITDEEHIPADVVQRMIIDPEIFGVVLVSLDGSAVFGRFGPGDPEPVTESGLTGKPVRCSTGL